MKGPLVSILMTVYNRQKFIREAIESVQALTYLHWELLIVDDQSDDRSVEIARKYEQKDARIKVYVNEKNLGDYPNRNLAATYARGKYLKYLDSDDIIYPHSLSIMVEAMDLHPDAAIGLAQSKPEDEKPYPVKLKPRESYRQHFIGRGVLNCGPSGSIIRRDIFEQEGGFSAERYLGDTEFWLRIAAKYPILKIHPALVWWRKHEGQEIKVGTTSNYYAIETYNLYQRVLESEACPLNENERSVAIHKLKQHHARKIIRHTVVERQIRSGVYMFRRSRLNIIELLSGLRPYVLNS